MSHTTGDAPSWRSRPDIAYTTLWTMDDPANQLSASVERGGEESYAWEVWCLRSRNMIADGVADSLEAARGAAEEVCR